MTPTPEFEVCVATEQHIAFAAAICEEMAESAKARGTGIAKRTPEYLAEKMREGKAIIALAHQSDGTTQWAGFCYIETWSHGDYVANSGLIVSPAFRKHGLARQIKEKAFELSRLKYPSAKLFGLTTGLAVMKINSDLGYEPVTYSELTQDEQFWAGCKSCVNFEILTSKQRKNCLCTAMLWDPAEKAAPAALQETTTPTAAVAVARRRKKRRNLRTHLRLFERWMRLKQFVFTRRNGGSASAANRRSLFRNPFVS